MIPKEVVLSQKSDLEAQLLRLQALEQNALQAIQRAQGVIQDAKRDQDFTVGALQVIDAILAKDDGQLSLPLTGDKAGSS